MLTYAKAKPDDIPLIYQMASELIAQYEDFSGMNKEKVLTWTKRSIECHLPQYTRVCLNDQLAAFYRLTAEDDKYELDNLFVLPCFRGQGIGSEILRKCISETDRDLFLYVFRENTGAVRLYERMGFRITESVSTTRQIMTYAKEGC